MICLTILGYFFHTGLHGERIRKHQITRIWRLHARTVILPQFCTGNVHLYFLTKKTNKQTNKQTPQQKPTILYHLPGWNVTSRWGPLFPWRKTTSTPSRVSIPWFLILWAFSRFWFVFIVHKSIYWGTCIKWHYTATRSWYSHSARSTNWTLIITVGL